MTSPDEHITENRRHWNHDAPAWVAMGRRAWSSPPSWGIWSVPETELGLFPDRLDGLDSVELGCGTAYVSSWLTRRGARATGIDLSEEQLATAATLRHEHDLDVSLVHGKAEQTPFGAPLRAARRQRAHASAAPFLFRAVANRLA